MTIDLTRSCILCKRNHESTAVYDCNCFCHNKYKPTLIKVGEEKKK